MPERNIEKYDLFANILAKPREKRRVDTRNKRRETKELQGARVAFPF